MLSRLLKLILSSTPGPRYCSRCGSANDSQATYCAGCGALLNA
jgi:hypothetical protein